MHSIRLARVFQFKPAPNEWVFCCAVCRAARHDLTRSPCCIRPGACSAGRWPGQKGRATTGGPLDERMSQKKPPPMYPKPQDKYCPVCGEVSYSREGIHPQCAQTQADQQRMSRQKARLNNTKAGHSTKTARGENKSTKSSSLKAWHKRCPKCGAQVHIRKAGCPCGHTFRAAGQ